MQPGAKSVPAALLAALLLAAAPAMAFTSAGSAVHDEITAVARDAGWGKDATKALQQAVREPDFHEMEVDPNGDQPARIDATEDYRPEHHCDRIPGTTDADAFEATVAYIHEQREAAAAASAAGHANDAVDALGRALHALQDCYSHSNIVDLPEQRLDFEAALLHRGAAVPGLRLVSFEPGADDPEDPPGDDYPHKAFAKDSADKNDECKLELPGGDTKFEAARDQARATTVAFLQEFMQERSEEERADILSVDPERGGFPGDINVPSPAVPLATAALLLAVAAARRRRP